VFTVGPPQTSCQDHACWAPSNRKHDGAKNGPSPCERFQLIGSEESTTRLSQTNHRSLRKLCWRRWGYPEPQNLGQRDLPAKPVPVGHKAKRRPRKAFGAWLSKRKNAETPLPPQREPCLLKEVARTRRPGPITVWFDPREKAFRGAGREARGRCNALAPSAPAPPARPPVPCGA